MALPHYSEGSRLFAAHFERQTQLEFARVARLNQSEISRLLSGHSIPSLATAVKLQKLLGVPVESWLQAANMHTRISPCAIDTGSPHNPRQ